MSLFDGPDRYGVLMGLAEGVETIVLERLPCVANELIHAEEMRELGNSHLARVRYLDGHLKTLVLMMDRFVWAQQVEESRAELRAPRDWWQAFKERWFPATVLRRWPVQYRRQVAELKRYVGYPDFVLPQGQYGRYAIRTTSHVDKDADR